MLEVPRGACVWVEEARIHIMMEHVKGRGEGGSWMSVRAGTVGRDGGGMVIGCEECWRNGT